MNATPVDLALPADKAVKDNEDEDDIEDHMTTDRKSDCSGGACMKLSKNSQARTALFAAFLMTSILSCTTDRNYTRQPSSEPVLLMTIGFAQVPELAAVVDDTIAKLGPVRTQENTALCAANAVADAVTLKTGIRVSAFSVAIRHYQKRGGADYFFFQAGGVMASQVSNESRYMLGLASEALEAVLDSSVCRDDQPENDLTYRDRDLKALWTTYQNYRGTISVKPPVKLQSQISMELSRIMPSLANMDFIQTLSRYKPLDHALGEWLDKKCDVQIPKFPTVKVVGDELNFLSADQVVSRIDKALAIKSLPIVHYDSRVLDGVDPVFVESVIGFHVSNIVAKRQIGGQNYYLLRNSWRAGCRIYADSVANRCDRGHIWLTESEVRKYVSTVAYFE